MFLQFRESKFPAFPQSWQQSMHDPSSELSEHLIFPFWYSIFLLRLKINRQPLNLGSLINGLYNCSKICTRRLTGALRNVLGKSPRVFASPVQENPLKERLPGVPKGPGVTTESTPQKKIRQPCQKALLMPTDSRGLPLNKCCVRLSTLIIAHRPLFWVSDCNPSHWQDKMTSAESDGRIMLQVLSFTSCIRVNDSNHLYTVNSAHDSPVSSHAVTNSPTLWVQ